MTQENSNVTYLENPITTEIIRNALNSAAQEMNQSLFRSAYSPVIYEMKDCSVGLFDAETNALGQSAGLPIFLGNLEVCIEGTLEAFGRENLREGDVFAMNDSYLTGTHLNDITVVSPIFFDGKIAGFTANRAHWLDVGSKDPGMPMDSTEIYQEGFRLGPTKIIDAGVPRHDVIDFIGRNSRFHRAALGDLNAQISACRTGEKRFQAILKRFGPETVTRACQDVFAQSERIARRSIKDIADGVYEAEGTLDSDGYSDEPVLVKVKVVIAGDEMSIDLDGSSAMRKGGTNCGWAQTVSACRVAYKALICPGSPVTGGTFKPLTVKAPPKSIFTAEEPAGVAWYFSHLGLLIDLVVKALAPVIPERAAAAHYGDSMVITFTGTDPRTTAPFLSVEATVGGWGASQGSDGQDALINNVNGDFKNLPVEVFENKYPLTLLRYGLRPDTGGRGAFRGGLGAFRDYLVDTGECYLYLWWERSRTPAWGLLGGEAAVGPQVVINPGGGNERCMLKVNGLKLTRGDVVSCRTGGGGGFGEPFMRDPEKARKDIIDGYLTRA
jgi:N-methylhydantoinase B